ncbi:MAG: HAD family hydrolase [Thermoplasmata archaeon]
MSYRAVSLDLWFTTIYHPRGQEARWDDSRVRFLGESMQHSDGSPPTVEEIRTAMVEVHSDLEAIGLNTGKVDPGILLQRYASRLNARCTLPSFEAAQRFSANGLREYPPVVSPDAVEVVRSLRGRGIPVIMITNTARRADSWKEFLGDQAGLAFEHIITSCEVGSAKPDGAIFALAARRLGVPAHEILHVGDRWELDVVGAQRAGFGAALYRGLWPRYPEGMYPETDARTVATSGVLCIDRLDELLVDGLVTAPREGRTSTVG